MINSNLIERVLERGRDDWVHLTEVVSIVDDAVACGAKCDVMDVLAYLVGRGLFVMGDLVKTNGGVDFVPWSVDKESSLLRVASMLDACNKHPSMSGNYWLDITALGETTHTAQITGT